jgi:hypothetical protein
MSSISRWHTHSGGKCNSSKCVGDVSVSHYCTGSRHIEMFIQSSKLKTQSKRISVLLHDNTIIYKSLVLCL